MFPRTPRIHCIHLIRHLQQKLILFSNFSLKVQSFYVCPRVSIPIACHDLSGFYIRHAKVSPNTVKNSRTIPSNSKFPLIDSSYHMPQMWCVARFDTICTIYKNVKNTHGGVLLLVKFQANPASLLKVTLFYACFSRFLNCTNCPKSCNGSHI